MKVATLFSGEIRVARSFKLWLQFCSRGQKFRAGAAASASRALSHARDRVAWAPEAEALKLDGRPSQRRKPNANRQQTGY